jgi:putative transposase
VTSTPTAVTQAFTYALDPTLEQASVMASHVGGTRFAYNALLGLVKENWDENRTKEDAGLEVTKGDYVSTTHFGLLYLWAKHRDELAPWWAENGSSTYNDAAQRLSRAFVNFRQGRASFPHFKRRGPNGSIRLVGSAVHLADSHHVRIARIGEVKTYESTRKLFRHLERDTGRIVAATLRHRNGTWQVSFTAEVTRQLPTTRLAERVIGVDVGLTTLYTGATPGGEQILDVVNPRHLVKSERSLARTQRIASRRQGPKCGVAPSNRWKRANSRVQKVHSRVANARKNLIHEITTHLAKDYDVIVVEDLNVAGMMKNHFLAKHISDAAWGEFTRQLEYKTRWYGSTIVKVDRFYPSSKTCSRCGAVKAKLPLTERIYACDSCGHKVDRDLNAAINLARQGLTGTSSVTGRRGEIRPEQQILGATAHPVEASTETLTLVGT